MASQPEIPAAGTSSRPKLAVLGSVDARHTGAASGFNSAIARTGGLLGTALLGGVLSALSADLIVKSDSAWIACALACMAAAIDAPCPGLWLLVATDGQNDMPKLDHAEIPLITPGQRAKVSEAWIDNVHRGRAEPVAAIAGSGRKGGN